MLNGPSSFRLALQLISIPVIISFFLTVIPACSSLPSTVTVYDIRDKTVASFRDNLSYCRELGATAAQHEGISWLFAAHLFGIEHNSGIAINNCLLAKGWRPRLQFVGAYSVTLADLEEALKGCGSPTFAAVIANAHLTGLAAENMVASNGGKGNGIFGYDEFRGCMRSKGWEIKSNPPWIPPENAAASHVVEPVAGDAGDKFVTQDRTVRDNGKSVAWLQHNSEKARGLDWRHARDYVKALNKASHGGYSDWRIPRRDEMLSLFNYTKWNGAGDVKDVLRQAGFTGVENGVYWTSTPVLDDTGKEIWGIDFATKNFVRLGRSSAYSANVLAVRGTGWGSRNPALPLDDPGDRNDPAGGDAELAARYLRYKAGGT